MSKLDKLIELSKLEKLDKLRQQEYYGDREDLIVPLTKTLNTNCETL